MNKISIIITVYNRVHLLRKSLISLLNQSVKPDELIISDDGSTENIKESISDIIEKFSFPVKFVKQKHNGFRLARCRNNGVKHSSGDLLIFIDQDIIHTKNFIKTFVDHQKEKRFITSYPIRLTEKQSENVKENSIHNNSFLSNIKRFQLNKIRKQFVKDYISFLGHKVNLVKEKPKLRGGVCAINRADYYNLNGYDEMFKGWGNEDDDIKRRLYKSGVSGYNPFLNEFPLHLFHEPFHQNGKRANQDYVNSKKIKIKSGEFISEYGVNNTLDQDEVEVIDLKK